MDVRRAWVGALLTLGLTGLPAAGPRAHAPADAARLPGIGTDPVSAERVWQTWNLAPEVIGLSLLAAILYLGGARRRRRPRLGRDLAFFAGLALVLAALVSPIDLAAEHLFVVHQVQHLLLRMAGPMLLMLALPQGVLAAGLPGRVRRHTVAPLIGWAALRGTLGALARPGPATLVYVGALFAWQLPGLHNAALLDEPLHYLMHITMLAAGLIFWWAIFDPRPAPRGARYGARLMMLWVQLFATIGLGAWLSLKGAVLYPAYDLTGRLWGLAPIADERLGGLVIWIPSSMMSLAGVLAVIARWGRHESRVSRGAAAPSTRSRGDETGIARARGNRARARRQAIGLGAFVAAAFLVVLAVAVASRIGAAPP